MTALSGSGGTSPQGGCADTSIIATVTVSRREISPPSGPVSDVMRGSRVETSQPFAVAGKASSRLRTAVLRVYDAAK